MLGPYQVPRESSIWKRLGNLPDDIQKAYDEAWSQIEDLEEPDKGYRVTASFAHQSHRLM
jgi:hypothetical protein